MADKKINELPVSSGLTDNALLPVYQNDQTHSITGALIKSFAVAAAKLQADAAAKSADAAAGSASTASGNAQTAGTAASAAGKSAQAAQTAKTAAETAKNGAEAARTAIENMLVEAITLASGQSATVSKSLVDQVVKLTFGLPAGPAGKDGAKGEPGRDGIQGPQGVGITSIDRTSGNGTPGTTDTYTIALSNGTSYTFTVYNGANGMGSGDFMASGSVAMTGNLRMGGHRMTGVGAPQADDDAVRRMDLTANNVKFADGENFQQKFDDGELTGPAGRDGVDGKDGAPGEPGQDGAPGTPGKNATINGVNALTFTATGGLNGTQSGTTYTLDGAGLRPKYVRVTLTAAGWNAPEKTQKVTVSGVLADETKQLIMPMPAMASQNAYAAAGIACTLQEENALTFTAQTVPTEAITVFVTVQGVSG